MSAEAKGAERRGGGWPRRRRRLLLVDQDAWCRGIADGILRASGYRVVCTGDPATAVGIARNMLPDLILADVQLDLLEAVPFLERRRHDGAAVCKPGPRVSEGYAILRPLEVDPELVTCPVVVLRDSTETEDALDGPRFGVPDYLSKPFTAEVLLEKVERSLHTTGLGDALGSGFTGAPSLRARRDTDPWNPHEALMQGTLDFVGVPAVLEMFHFNQLSGLCTLRAPDGRSAEVGFEEGEIVTATTSDGLGGADAVFHIVAWTRGRFAFTRARPLAATPFKTRFEQLILEGLRRLDEQRRGHPALALDASLKGLNFRDS